MTQVPYGWLIRSVHAWGASFFIAVVGLHFLSVLFTKAYRKPRELTWLSGMCLLGLAVGFGFSGYLLPWNELAVAATKVGTDIPGIVPVVGEFIVHFLRGGTEVTGATLTRFYGFHVAFMPAILGAFLGRAFALDSISGDESSLGHVGEKGSRRAALFQRIHADRFLHRLVVFRGARDAWPCCCRRRWARRPIC